MYLKLEVQTSCPNNDFDEYRKKKEWIVQNHTITMQKKTENLTSSIGHCNKIFWIVIIYIL